MNPQNALKQTGDIMKARWPEVVLIVAMQVGVMLLLERMFSLSEADIQHRGTIPEWAMFVLGVGMMLMGVVWQMLYLGFLRTAALNGPPAHEPMTLLMTGRSFFWRFLGTQLVLGAVLWVIAGLLAGVLGTLLGYPDPETFPRWLGELVGVCAIAIFVKPFFLIQAYMLALNTSPMEAFGLMRQSRLGELGLLLKGYALGLTIAAAAAVASALAPRGTAGYYVAVGASYLIQSLVFLALMLATVLVLVPEENTSAAPENE